MQFEVRPATPADLPEMLRLWRGMMDHHARLEPRFRPLPHPEGEGAWEKHVREDVLPNETFHVLVADAGDRLVGQIIGAMNTPLPVFEPGPYAFVTDIVVDPAARRQGVGRRLFAALKAWFVAQGATHIELQVAHANPAAQAFWRDIGCSDYMDHMWYDLEEK
jgi:ribosomal protein S18 acetylase RimI-like enzyme